MKNNYNTNLEMEDIELHVSYDSLMAQDEFRNCFERLSDNFYFFCDYGNDEKPDSVTDCFDLSACTEKDFRSFALSQDVFANMFSREPMTDRDKIREKVQTGLTWKDYVLEELLPVYTWKEVAKEGLPEISNAKALYDICSVTGFCQGDFAMVLYKVYNPESNMYKHFENLLFSQPIYARLTVDGDEYYIEEAFDSNYDWDKDVAFEWIKANVKYLSEKALEWIEENLPEYPEYD